MIYPITNEAEFSSICLDAWHKNSAFWDRTRAINTSIQDFIKNEIGSKPESGLRIADVGCGNGWLYESLLKKNHNAAYVGIDYNDYFIDKLKEKHPRIEWHCSDFTNPVDERFANRFNVAVSCLSIIEMPSLEIPFQNFNKMLQPDGSLILITLDPYFEIVRLNSDYQKLEQDFTAFRQSSHSKYYKKEIMIDGKGSGNYYYGVLHTLTYLQKIIASNNLSVVKYEELNFIEGGIQKPIYHAYVLRKNGSK